MAAFTLGTGSVVVGLIVGCWIIVIGWIFPSVWADIVGIFQPVKFHFAWLSFLRRRRRTEEFIALADRLRRDRVQEPVERNLISGS
jgi:hypothetical protein